MSIRHDSRDPFDRNPGGAIPCGAALRLRVHTETTHAFTLRLWHDGVETRVDMRDIGCLEGMRVLEADVEAPASPCLWWYFFEMHTDEGIVYYGNDERCLGGEGRLYAHQPPSYQITVYDPAYDTPHWMREGVCYHILVDRFYDGKDGAYLARRDDIRVHEDWYERPYQMLSGPSKDNIADDFFGGNLPGVTAKLDYLRDLGVTALYLGPVFEARTNHKYDTGDYKRIDPTFGDEDDLRALCREAKARGMRVLLDGVFSHTGDDSVYFNRRGRYPTVGACQSKSSPYYSWFKFQRYPDAYKCWWDFPTLPEVDKDDPGFVRFMLEDDDAVCARWVRRGTSGWRLDVADELPDAFLDKLRARVKAEDPEAALIGEVWEDASNKIAYGKPRHYVFGHQLDSVMNYPLRLALIDFLLAKHDAQDVVDMASSLMENYPKPFLYSTLNLMGSHDRARIINVLAGRSGEELPQEKRGDVALTDEQARLGKARALLMLDIICALPGMPGIYYGDEAGLTGAPDPFCRGTYPWGREDAELLAGYRERLHRRAASRALRTGHCRLEAPCRDTLLIHRWTNDGADAFGEPCADERVWVALNRSAMPRTMLVRTHVPLRAADGRTLTPSEGIVRLPLPGHGSEVLQAGI